MVRIKVKGIPYTNKFGRFRKVYKLKNKKEFVIIKKRRRYLN